MEVGFDGNQDNFHGQEDEVAMVLRNATQNAEDGDCDIANCHGELKRLECEIKVLSCLKRKL